MIRLLLVLLVCSFYTTAQVNYVLPNEKVIFSFETLNGKRAVLAKDKSDAYIIYRFGSKRNIEMEFPAKTKDSWKKFKYSFYLRGGGIENAGLDLNYVYFNNNGIRYVLYDTYSSESGTYAVGVKVFKADKEIADIKGNNKTRRGTMIDFRGNGQLEIGEELFD